MPETLPDVPEQTVSQVQTAPSATESPAEETRKPVAPEKPQEIPKPAETEPQPAPEAPEETKPKSAYDFEFDMEAIKADCIDIGKGMGLHLDTSLTPSNATWWNPVTASQSNQGTKLKQREEFLRMSELLFFIIGTALGSLTGVVLMCLLQINRLSKREEVENAKTKCAGTVPLE